MPNELERLRDEVQGYAQSKAESLALQTVADTEALRAGQSRDISTLSSRNWSQSFLLSQNSSRISSQSLLISATDSKAGRVDSLIERIISRIWNRI